MALLNTLTTKITGFDANQWGIFIVNKTLDSLPYLTDKTFNVIIITSPYFGYAFYGTLGIAASLKLAEFGYNYNYFLSKTVEKTPVVSQVSWGINKVRNAFSKEGVDSTEIEYYPLFDRVISKLYLDKISITFDSQNISPVVPVNSPAPAPSVPNTVTAVTTTTDIATTTNPEIPITSTQTHAQFQVPVQPQIVFRDRFVYRDRDKYANLNKKVVKKQETIIYQDRNVYIPTVEYRDRENLVQIREDINNLSSLVVEQKLIAQGLSEGSLALAQALQALDRYNAPVFLRNYGVNEKAFLTSIHVYNSPAVSGWTTKFKLNYNDSFEDVGPNTIILDIPIFREANPLITKILELCTQKSETIQAYKRFPGILIKYSVESSSFFTPRKHINPSESTLYAMDVFENANFMPKSTELLNEYYTGALRTNVENAITQWNSKVDQALIVKETRDSYVQPREAQVVFLAADLKKFIPEQNQAQISVNLEDFMDLASKATKKRQALRYAEFLKIKAKRKTVFNELLEKHGVNNEEQPISTQTNTSTDVISPLVAGSTIVLTGAVSGLTQIPIEDAWNVIFNSQACVPLLSDSHFISVVTNAFPNLQIPVQETARALDTAHSVVETVVTNSTSSSTSPVAEGSFSVSKINVTSFLNGILPNLSWSNIIIGAGVVGVTAYLWKNGYFAHANAVQEHSQSIEALRKMALDLHE